jgi:hypothetical protein
VQFNWPSLPQRQFLPAALYVFPTVHKSSLILFPHRLHADENPSSSGPLLGHSNINLASASSRVSHIFTFRESQMQISLIPVNIEFGLQVPSLGTLPRNIATHPEIKTIVKKITNFMLKHQGVFQNCREIQEVVAFYIVILSEMRYV